MSGIEPHRWADANVAESAGLCSSDPDPAPPLDPDRSPRLLPSASAAAAGERASPAMRWPLWYAKVTVSSVCFALSVYYTAQNLVLMVEFLPGEAVLRGWPRYMFGALRCSLAAAFEAWILRGLFRRARAARARQQRRQQHHQEEQEEEMDELAAFQAWLVRGFLRRLRALQQQQEDDDDDEEMDIV
ncbi:hypothetical protein EJB05_33158, partial [Eragrostis curvula]